MNEASEERDHINRCLDLLTVVTNPTYRATITDLLAYLRKKEMALKNSPCSQVGSVSICATRHDQHR